MTTKCCKCDKVRVGDNWTDIVKVSADERISHSYCPDCLLVFRREIERQRNPKFAATPS